MNTDTILLLSLDVRAFSGALFRVGSVINEWVLCSPHAEQGSSRPARPPMNNPFVSGAMSRAHKPSQPSSPRRTVPNPLAPRFVNFQQNCNQITHRSCRDWSRQKNSGDGRRQIKAEQARHIVQNHSPQYTYDQMGQTTRPERAR